jgi:hypothetical protein
MERFNLKRLKRQRVKRSIVLRAQIDSHLRETYKLRSILIELGELLE